MKAIFITGGGSGIGRAVAQLFAARGWRIGLADVNAAGLAETAALLPGGAATFVFDVTDRAPWDAPLAAFAGGGGIDVLFNNAGIAAGGVFAEMTPAAIERTIAVNLTGVIHGARASHPFLKASGGCLLNTASAAGIYGTAGAAVYSATKFGVRGLTEALDGEWAADGVRVRSLMPGFIDTPLLDASLAGSNYNVRQQVRAAGWNSPPSRWWHRRHGTRCMATASTRRSAPPPNGCASPRGGCRVNCGSRCGGDRVAPVRHVGFC